MVKLAVLGSGSWGTVLANLLVKNQHDVTLWGHRPEIIKELAEQRTNHHYLADFKVQPELQVTTDLAQAVQGVDAILFAVPTSAIREVANQVFPIIKNRHEAPILISAAKGLEQKTHKRISQIFSDVMPAEFAQRLVIFSGPSHAEDVAVEDLTSLTVAAHQMADAEWTQRVFMNHYFRLYTNDDMVGVELGGALKNVMAIGAGILHGAGYGDNTKAALMTRGLAEMTRFGTAMGARPLTFMGLSGIGDLIVTCTSVHSRNWRAGHALGQGQPLAEVLKDMGMVVEGYWTAKAVHEAAQEQQIDMPISESIYQVLYEQADIQTKIAQMMQRSGKSEAEFEQ